MPWPLGGAALLALRFKRAHIKSALAAEVHSHPLNRDLGGQKSLVTDFRLRSQR